MITALRDDQTDILDGVYKSMFIINASAPESAPAVFQRLRFADARERISQDVFNQRIDAFQNLLVVALPVEIILPCLLMPVNH